MAQGTQGSRGALVAWTVVTSILAVTCLILAIYFYVDADRATKTAAQQLSAVNEVATPDVVRNNADAISALRDARNEKDLGLDPQMKLFNVALAMRDKLAQLVGGNNQASAFTAAKAAIQKAKDAGARPATDSLVATVTALINELQARNTEVENLKADSAESKRKLEQTVNATGEQMKTMTAAMEQVRAERDKALADFNAASQGQRETFNTAAEDLQKQLALANETINDLNAKNGALGKENETLKTQVESVQARLNEFRVDPTRAVVQRADGHIVRVPGNNQCFIDIGRGDQVVAGMTFEVYDKVKGIPPAGDPSTDTNLPIGKASIEVIEPGPSSSLCRVIRLNYGEALAEGDLIVNLVYDRNTKYNFVVYGNFDLDQNGVATPQDSEVIKRLITQWGGNVVSDINVDTDFVVLGKEPVIPDRPDETDPIAMARYVQAVSEADQYAEIAQRARSYRLPILNQNRFLYMVGYFEQSRR
jgi:hypothetical protein